MVIAGVSIGDVAAAMALIVVAAVCIGAILVVSIRTYWISRSASHYWLSTVHRMDHKKGDRDHE